MTIMTTGLSHQRQRAWSGFTLLELLLVAVIIAILAALMLPVLSKTKGRSLQIECLSQLRQVGVASLTFAHDHGDRFPFQVPVKDGGTLELVKSASPDGADIFFAFRHFQALSNELGVARLLRCPSDSRTGATTFEELRNDNISYFLAVTADPSKPDSLLAGDRNIMARSSGSGAILKLTALEGAKWTSAIHEFKGNLLFAGGHVERTANQGLQVALQNPDGPVRVWVPSAPPASLRGGSSAPGKSPSASPGERTGFDAMQKFFATPQGPSSGQSAAPSSPLPPARTPQVATVRGDGTPAPQPPPQVQPPAPAEPKPVSKPPVVPPVAPPVPETLAAPSLVAEPEPAQEPLAFLVAPERCWWCWWLMIAAGLFTAFILGFFVHRRRRARRMAKGWTPDWQAPQRAGRR